MACRAWTSISASSCSEGRSPLRSPSGGPPTRWRSWVTDTVMGRARAPCPPARPRIHGRRGRERRTPSVSALELSVLDLLRLMEEQRASDIYLKAGSPPMYRIDGEVRPGPHGPLNPADVAQLAGQMMTDQEQQRFAREQSVDLAYSAGGVGRFRVNIYRQRGSVAIVARRVRLDVPTLGDLHLPPALNDLAMAPRGLILVTGPAGSGKSTTLAAMIEHRN